jgi:hypothetical protein
MFRPLTRRLSKAALLVGIVLAVLMPAAAWADGSPPPPTTTPPPTTPLTTPGYPTPGYPTPQTCTYPYPNPQVCTNPAGATSASPTATGSLPFTGGGDVALTGVIGAVVVAGGLALVVISRRRRTVTH